MELIDFTSKAIGVPFKDQGRDFSGWDCYGPILLAYRECYGIELPDYQHISAMNSKEAGELFEAHRQSWVEVPERQERPGDVIWLRHGSWACHVGLIVKAGLMVHCDMGVGTCVEPYTSGPWKTRVMGIFRHADLAS